MHGGDPGGTEAGVVILGTVQRSRSTSFPFDIPVERERVRGHTKGAGRPNHRSAKHLRQDQLVLAHFQSLQFGFNCSVLLKSSSTCMGGGWPPWTLGTTGETPGSRGVADACPPLPSSPLTWNSRVFMAIIIVIT